MSPATNGPTPAGVPARMTSPGSSVNACEAYEMNSATECTISPRVPSWRTSPFTRVTIRTSPDGVNSVSMAGPRGQNVSKPFARAHCPSVFCRSRAVTSLPIV